MDFFFFFLISKAFSKGRDCYSVLSLWVAAGRSLSWGSFCFQITNTLPGGVVLLPGRQISSSDASGGSPGDPPQPSLGMKFASLISLFSSIILAHSPSSLLPPPLWGSHAQLVPQALGRPHSLLAWADRSAKPRGRWRDNSRLCLLSQARTEAQRQLSLSGKKSVRAFFQLLGLFPLLFWAERKRQGDPDLWPQEDHWPICEENHLIWLHISLTLVKGGGVLGLVFAFWFF